MNSSGQKLDQPPRRVRAARTAQTPEERARRRSIDALIGDVLSRRAAGENVQDEDVLSANASLRPELEAELKAVHEIHQIMLAARKAGPITNTESQPLDLPHPPVPLDVPGVPDKPNPVAIQGYTILGEINAGGQATVYRANQDATQRAVAIKVIPGGLLTSTKHRARFDREAAIMAKLDHPNIVGILDRGRTADGSLFLVMPFIDGKALDEHLQQLNAAGFNLPELLKLFVEICNAIAEAHRQGVIHRDLKPANIRVDQHGRPHILDFGLARTQEGALADSDRKRDITMTGQIVGSLPWTSPEQVSQKREAIDARTDVYALGVMLYQAVTDEFPYPVFGSVHEVLNNIALRIPKLPSQMPTGIARKIDADMDAIIMRALAKQTADRYFSALELAEDLQRHIDGKRLSRETKAVGRTTWGVKIAAAVFVISILGALTTWFTADPEVRVVPLPSTVVSISDPNGDPQHNTSLVNMRMVRIVKGLNAPAVGQVVAGQRFSESTTKPVGIDHDFYIGVTEVTQKQYRDLMGKLPGAQQDVGDSLPVQSVTWDDAVAFCDRLSELTGKQFRLPTEEEWEYACRAGTTGDYAGTGRLRSMGWYQGNSGGHVQTVAGKQPNHWGLYDMHGNVQEWTVSNMPSIFEGRTLKGGSAVSSFDECSASSYNKLTNNAARSDVGFRVVKNP